MADKKILIVDDDRDIIKVVKASLASPGRAFISAEDGIEALKQTFTEIPDLVVLDIMMPKMNGYQVCRLLKNDKRTWQIPVLMLTAKAKDKDRFYGMAVGADAYVVKPFHTTELREKVEELLNKSALRDKTLSADSRPNASDTDLLSKVNSLLDRKLQEMTFLQYMTRSMVSTFDEDNILRTLLGGISTDLGYRRVVIFMRDAAGAMTERMSSGMPKRAEQMAFSLDDAHTTSRLFNAKEPVLLSSGLLFTGADTGDGIQQCLIPVVYRDEARGVILLERRGGEPPFSEERIGVLATLAVQLGLALDNARLYKATLHLSLTDGLTGLFNARYFYNRLEIEITRARRYNHDLSLFMLDIDLFKHYNDTYGHLSGDEALKQIAGILKENSRETDTVARYGGEEFCVILPETDADSALVLAERVRKAVESSPVCPGEGKTCVKLTISIGIATLPEGVEVAEDLVRMADGALYKAKEEGRNRVCVYC